MGFFKTLFTGKEATTEEKEAEQQRNDFDMFKYDGIQALSIGKVDFAIACFEHALEIQDDAEVRHNYVNALMRNEDFDEAICQLEHLCQMQPENENVSVALAELYFQQERYDEAADTCKKAIETWTELPAPHYIMAKVEHAMGKLFEAVAQSTLAICKQNDYEEARMLRAKLLIDMGQTSEATEDIEHLLSLNADNDEALMLKACCKEMQGKTDEAKELYHKVIDINPFMPQAYINLAGILRAEGNDKEAAEMAAEGLRLSPELMQDITGEYNNK